MSPVGRLRRRLTVVALVLASAACGDGDDPRPSVSTCSAASLRQSGTDLCLGTEAVQSLRALYSALSAGGTLMNPRGGFDPRYYPSETLASVDAVARLTGDAALADWVARELDALEARIASSHGFLIWPDLIDGQPTFGPNAQARLLLSLLAMNAEHRSPQLERMIASAHAALERLATVDVTSSTTGRVYPLPPYAFHEPAAPRAITTRSVDPNQDAALAAAYALYARWVAAADPAAATAAFRKARSYASASMDMMQAGVCTPLADQIEFKSACDTRYNSFHIGMLALYAAQADDDQAASAVTDQYMVLRHVWLAGRTSRHYPARYEGAMPDPVELMLLLPVVARFAPEDSNALAARIQELYRSAAGAVDWPVGWLFPRSYVHLAAESAAP